MNRSIRDLYETPRELMVELVGGPLDGRVFPAFTGQDGMPLEQLLVPVEKPPLRSFSEQSEFPVEAVGIQADRYCRDRISDTSHRWIYVHSSIPLVQMEKISFTATVAIGQEVEAAYWIRDEIRKCARKFGFEVDENSFEFSHSEINRRNMTREVNAWALAYKRTMR